jgi:predicted HicB family RNase H-like nuclease
MRFEDGTSGKRPYPHHRHAEPREASFELATMMEYKGYIAEVEFDDEAKIFRGEVINLGNVITFQGTSVTELQQPLEIGVDAESIDRPGTGRQTNSRYTGTSRETTKVSKTFVVWQQRKWHDIDLNDLSFVYVII